MRKTKLKRTTWLVVIMVVLLALVPAILRTA
jgi:preprotein translocase subunit SecE